MVQTEPATLQAPRISDQSWTKWNTAVVALGIALFYWSTVREVIGEPELAQNGTYSIFGQSGGSWHSEDQMSKVKATAQAFCKARGSTAQVLTEVAHDPTSVLHPATAELTFRCS